jgi:hypothetical protein
MIAFEMNHLEEISSCSKDSKDSKGASRGRFA